MSPVTTQQQLDAALAAGDESIVIGSSAGVWLRLYGSATVTACGSATVEAYGSATVRAHGSATVEAYDSATVEAYDSATVRASDSATVRASGSATVRAYDSATVTAYGSAAVHLHSGHAKVSGGVLIDVTALDLTDPQAWCDYHGVPVADGIATVHKAVDDQWTTGRGTDYSPGTLPACDDWCDNNDCGGGLHFSPHPWQSRDYYPSATRYVAVGVALADLRPILGGTPKCKAPRVVVACREVNVDGEAVS